MARSLADWLLPVVFFIEGVFWVGVVATGGAAILAFGAATGILSGVLLIAAPNNWVTRPFAGATALFGLVLTVFQAYEAATLLGGDLGSIGTISGAVFTVFAIVCVYLEMGTLSLRTGKASKKA